MHSLDFNDVPDLSYTRAAVAIDSHVARAMAKLPETLERARCATHFCYCIRNPDADVFIRQGYMRASLAEFIGMEGTLVRDLAKLGSAAQPIKANSGSKPLLHIIRELRNFEMHLHSSPLSPEKKSVLWGHPDRPEEAIPLDCEIWVIDDLTEAQFHTLNNARNYQAGDIPKLLTWFNSAQREWGIRDLILRAVEDFCREMIAAYSL